MIHVQDIGIATIAIPLKYDNVGREMSAKKSAKKCAATSEFLFWLLKLLLLNFLVSVFVVKVARERLLRYHRKQLLICNNFVETLTI